MNARCAGCGFRFERSDEHYFAGAVFVNYMFCGSLFLVSFLITMLVTWPDVPWGFLTYGMPVVMVSLVVLLHPAAKVMWLSIDVLMRPVTPDELIVAPEADGERSRDCAEVARPKR